MILPLKLLAALDVALYIKNFNILPNECKQIVNCFESMINSWKMSTSDDVEEFKTGIIHNTKQIVCKTTHYDEPHLLYLFDIVYEDVIDYLVIASSTWNSSNEEDYNYLMEYFCKYGALKYIIQLLRIINGVINHNSDEPYTSERYMNGYYTGTDTDSDLLFEDAFQILYKNNHTTVIDWCLSNGLTHEAMNNYIAQTLIT